MKFKAYLSPTATSNPQYALVKQFFEVYGGSIVENTDVRTLMLMTKGRVNPNGGFVVMVYGEMCMDIFDVVRTYERMGLRPC